MPCTHVFTCRIKITPSILWWRFSIIPCSFNCYRYPFDETCLKIDLFKSIDFQAAMFDFWFTEVKKISVPFRYVFSALSDVFFTLGAYHITYRVDFKVHDVRTVVGHFPSFMTKVAFLQNFGWGFVPTLQCSCFFIHFIHPDAICQILITSWLWYLHLGIL